ncbi:hypothetical protein AC629_21685 [Bradyrhizobium sp. NAS80.1]|nr:hypothetical protein AC629_21685 [Bradyrhizobium sp. NAS80.1]
MTTWRVFAARRAGVCVQTGRWHVIGTWSTATWNAGGTSRTTVSFRQPILIINASRTGLPARDWFAAPH